MLKGSQNCYFKILSDGVAMEIILNTFSYTLVLLALIKPENSYANLGTMLQMNFVKPKIMVWLRERS